VDCSVRHFSRTRILWISMVKRPEREPDHSTLLARFRMRQVRGDKLTGQEKLNQTEERKEVHLRP
jgi:hypothetical protein